MLINRHDEDLYNYLLKDNYNQNCQQYNQHKSKGRTSFKDWTRKQKLKVGKSQLEIANKLWREACFNGLVTITIDQLGDHLRPVSRNWKRDLRALIDKGLLSYVHVEEAPTGAYQLNQQASLMFNPTVTFGITKWSYHAHRQWLEGCYKDGCYRSCRKYWQENAEQVLPE